MYIFCREWTTDPRIRPPPFEMAEMAAQSGVRILAVTPHANQTGIEGVEDGYVNYESEQLEEQFTVWRGKSTENTFPSAWCAAWKS